METARINIESNATRSLPLIVVVRQTTGILSWQIPLLVESKDLGSVIYNKTSRNLCSTKYDQFAPKDKEDFIIVGISTASRENILFNVNLTEVTDFYIKYVLYKQKFSVLSLLCVYLFFCAFYYYYFYSLGDERTVQISPSEPIYYGYIFPQQTENSTVIVRVESDNDTCMTVSVQNTSVSHINTITCKKYRCKQFRFLSLFSVLYSIWNEILNFPDAGRQYLEEELSQYQ